LALSSHVADDHYASESDQTYPSVGESAQRNPRDYYEIRVAVNYMIQKIALGRGPSRDSRDLAIDRIEESVNRDKDECDH